MPSSARLAVAIRTAPMLAVLLWRARRKPFKNDPRPWSWREATLVVFYSGLYAATDEFHQWFIPSRGASVWDTFLDMLAAAAGLLLLWRLGRGRSCGESP